MSAPTEIETISILGCGWYGFALAKQLLDEGFKVKGSSTSDEKLSTLYEHGIEPYKVIFEPEKEAYDLQFFDCDVLIISIPPKRSSGEAALYPEKIRKITEAACRHQVKRLIFISSTAVYGDCNMEVTEDNTPNPDTESGEAMLAAESIVRQKSTFLTTIVRFGGLIGPARDPARFFAGKKDIPNGKAPVNLIHLEDCIGLTLEIVRKNTFGYTFNACCTDHPAKMDFYTKAAAKSGLAIPQFIDERTKWKIVSSSYLDAVVGYPMGTLDKS
ncbi:SDR family oxidoreductase [Paradesertivirga mongoliensis]|uniref:SDR family oxidoreductase n=1 Tax=Paradesertivirga mongoliensis TaxID=2100740 RepID=A0ABW4ZNG9_9SPHI|nr:SDR family oxidoreductase [Pedobacter mongoliensis]